MIRMTLAEIADAVGGTSVAAHEAALRRIEQACNILKAFQNAHPANQPDAE